MEKSSRVNKYRNLRESLKEDATLPKQEIQEQSDDTDDTKIPTLREYRMKQFVEEVKEYENELDGVKTELEENKEIEDAIGKVRMTSGKGQQYNTRLDILNHIQSGAIKKVDKTPIVVPVIEEEIEDVEKIQEVVEPIHEEIEIMEEVPTVVEEIEEEIEPVKHFKIFFEDDEVEPEEETIEMEEDFVEEVKEEKPSIFKRNKVFEEDEEEYDEDEDDSDEEVKSSVTMKVLTGLIVVLSICLIALLGYIIKLFLF